MVAEMVPFKGVLFSRNQCDVLIEAHDLLFLFVFYLEFIIKMTGSVPLVIA